MAPEDNDYRITRSQPNFAAQSRLSGSQISRANFRLGSGLDDGAPNSFPGLYRLQSLFCRPPMAAIWQFKFLNLVATANPRFRKTLTVNLSGLSKPPGHLQAIADVQPHQSQIGDPSQQFQSLHQIERRVECSHCRPSIQKDRTRDKDQQPIGRDEGHALFLRCNESTLPGLRQKESTGARRHNGRYQNEEARHHDPGFYRRNCARRAQQLGKQSGAEEAGNRQCRQKTSEKMNSLSHSLLRFTRLLWTNTKVWHGQSREKMRRSNGR